MITISLTWHFFLVIILQLLIIVRLVYMFANDDYDGMYSALFAFFYINVSIAMWLIYGGIAWW